ncbi:hypothetical protein GAN98_04840 [Bacteroides thetaiotaomicron]|uniref:Transmembrane protein n=1 Tax=Bacteroides thetaiotaomicron TaxID=818 RepID=A0A6I0SFV7_BACT4|nr:hypothetical protein GAN98_04840 [Bacteroides thetaiotaomicron]KAB4467520.1 hypothetical protein GAN67_04840 [Bacteroides thetaiotaomicron]KAB4477538.1 hypothetical protein GAN76_04840 [Bacteroides thetaiotaomicron]KAB4479320.1 hypothetical protein GAN59_02035 [Bacteroides thetaiotaomicron]KAB4488540.1 hypothetical protein GAN57_04865 [Bacteroides thetaiotaomicron]
MELYKQKGRKSVLIFSLPNSFIVGNRCLIGCYYVLSFIRFILFFFFLLPSKIQNKKGKVKSWL